MASVFELRRELQRQGVPERTIQKFLDYFRSNLDIFHEFVRHTLEQYQKGNRVGAKWIMEQVRKEPKIMQNGKFKIQNSMTAYYPIALELKHPGLKGYFVKKKKVGIK